MNKIILCLLGLSVFYSSDTVTSPAPTKAAVVIAGSIVAQNHDNENKKYKRKDCPVCKGKGWYISGDSIKKVDCGYCEPEKTDPPLTTRR